MQMATGTYTGDGNDNRSITGVGFQPDLVIIKGDTTKYAVWCSSAMTVGDSAFFADNLAHFTDSIQLLEADGFQIGTNDKVNTNTVAYHWIAFRDNGGGDFKVGTYTGDGADNRSITGVGFQPNMVLLKGDTARYGVWRPSSLAGDSTLHFKNFNAGADLIQAFEADGFQIGTHAIANGNGLTYHYAAWLTAASQFAVGTYVGDGNDDRSITGVGFQPDYMWTKAVTARTAHHRSDTCTTIDLFFTNFAGGDDFIQDLEADGFQLGTHVHVNENTVTYHYACWKKGVTTHQQAIAATAVGSASLTTTASFYRTLAATASGTAVVATIASYYRTLAATASGTAVVSTVASYYKALAATAVGAAVVSTAANFYRTLGATAVGSSSILVSSYVRSKKIFSKIIQSFGIVQK